MATFVGIATENSNFSILVSALQYIDANLEGSALVATLDDPDQDLTVFAPTNAAFGQLAVDLGFDGDPADPASVTAFIVTNVDVGTLNAIVTYHVAGTALSAEDIANAGSVTTLQSGTIGAGNLPSLEDKEPDLVDPTLTSTDLPADNGFLHIIDRVLLPVDLPGNSPEPTIVEIAGGNPDFSVLVATLAFIDANLEGSDLIGALSDPEASLTVFAPTNAAFGQLAVDLGFDGDAADPAAVATFLTENVDVETLNAVVTYHVAGTALSSGDIAEAGTVTTLQGGTIGAGALPALEDKEPDLVDPTLVETDIAAANGVVHVIDRVLLPVDLPGNSPEPTIVEIAGGNPDFSVLVATLAFIDANLEGSDLIGALSDPEASLTVFAPTNAAFGQLAVDLGFDGDAADPAAVATFLTENVDVETLNAVVTYHVAGTALSSGDIAEAGTVTTLQGGTIGAGALPALEDKEPDLVDPTLVETDIAAANGVVHVIDRVLLPVDLPGNSPEPTIVEIAGGNPDFSVLVATLAFIDANLEGSDLIGALSDPEASLTVFAPTNAAFGQLAVDLGFDGDAADPAAVATFLTENVDVETLNAVVTYHVAGTALSSGDIAEAGTVTTLQGGTIGAGALPALEDKEPDLVDPTLVETDIAAANGVVHVIDRVLLPVDLPGNSPEPTPSITEIVAASGEGFDSDKADFDILLQAVKTAGLAETLADADVDLTVFAPTDAAFIGLAQDIGYHGHDEAGAWSYLVDALTVLSKGDPVALLTTVLTYHVADGSLFASDVLGLSDITTLQGGTVGVSGASLIDNDPDTPDADLITTDVTASNGVVHVIDEVLIPVDLLAGPKSDLEIGTNGKDFIYTGRGDDFALGKGGADYILLGFGDDVALGGKGRDVISGWSGDDHIDGGASHDLVYGSWGNDVVKGGSGNDLVFGGSGDDTVEGGTGRDKLFGGHGSDVFVFNEGDGFDQIRDFNVHDDKIDLSDYGFDSVDDINIGGSWFRARIDLGDGDLIFLSGVGASHLTEDNFIL